MNLFKKTALAAGLAATALATTTPAMAQDYRRGNDNTAAVAIGAGILGLAVGAIAASSNNRDDRYYDRGDRYYASDWSYRDGYYWDRDGGRHGRDEYQRRNNHRDDYRDDHRRGYGRDRGDYRRGY
ncbi:MAG TPA: hypothetical protein VMQ93_06355 [Novosphingobium sp.]|nr:hypothetical protein [Novosphingobium sp.]